MFYCLLIYCLVLYCLVFYCLTTFDLFCDWSKQHYAYLLPIRSNTKVLELGPWEPTFTLQIIWFSIMWQKCTSITTKYSTWIHIYICTQFCWVISVTFMEYNLIDLDLGSIIFCHLSYLLIRRQLRSGKHMLVYCLTMH